MGENINKVKKRAYGTHLIANFYDVNTGMSMLIEKEWLTILFVTNASASNPQRMNPESKIPFERKAPARQKYTEARAHWDPAHASIPGGR